MPAKLFVGIALFFFAAVAVTIVNYHSTPRTAEDVKNLVSPADYQRLAKLEEDFCHVCEGQNSEEWGESDALLKIVSERNAVLDKYGLRKSRMAIFTQTRFHWQCHYDDLGGRVKRCEQ